MGFNPICPECGFESNEVRCPRCNTLKVTGCTGSCFMCGNKPSCQKRIPSPPVSSAGTQESVEQEGTSQEVTGQQNAQQGSSQHDGASHN